MSSSLKMNSILTEKQNEFKNNKAEGTGGALSILNGGIDSSLSTYDS